MTNIILSEKSGRSFDYAQDDKFLIFLFFYPEFHIFEFVYRAGIHDVEIILSGRKSLRDLHSSDLRIQDREFGILEDEIIIKLNGDDFIESISLDDDEALLIVPDDTRGDIRDIDTGIRVGEGYFLV